MSGIDKARMQYDARRTVANRRTTGASSPEQAIVHHLGVELYKERHRKQSAADEPEAKEATDSAP